MAAERHLAVEQGQKPRSIVVAAGQRGDSSQFDPAGHHGRHAVECAIDRLKRHRAVATRYGKPAVSHEAAVLFAAVNEWL